MTEHAKTHVRRRRKILVEKRRKNCLLLLALVLFLGSGVLLFHKDKLYTLNEVFSWIQQNHPGEVIASPPLPQSEEIYMIGTSGALHPLIKPMPFMHVPWKWKTLILLQPYLLKF